MDSLLRFRADRLQIALGSMAGLWGRFIWISNLSSGLADFVQSHRWSAGLKQSSASSVSDAFVLDSNGRCALSVHTLSRLVVDGAAGRARRCGLDRVAHCGCRLDGVVNAPELATQLSMLSIRMGKRMP